MDGRRYLDDVEAGNRAGCYTIHLDNGGETEWVKGDYRQPLYAVKDMAAAADIICRMPGPAHRCQRSPALNQCVAGRVIRVRFL